MRRQPDGVLLVVQGGSPVMGISAWVDSYAASSNVASVRGWESMGA